jgi:predicted DNA-binding transcriptional regulator YafY
MAETATTQAVRLVELVAWMSQRDSAKPVSYRAAARRLGVTEEIIRADLGTLVGLTDAYKPWLASLNVAILADGFIVESRGSFRRPFRLTPEEALALVIGLAGARGGAALAKKLGAALSAAPDAEAVGRAYGLGPTPSAHLDQVLAQARQARAGRLKLEIHYCGLGAEPAWRVVHPHQVVQYLGVWYVIAWCEKVCDFRHFRAERVLESRLLVQDFKPQILFTPIREARQLLQAEETVTATVAFSKRIARWLKERYPDGREDGAGRYLVTFKVADPAWLAREVLQYGAEAEVVGPESLRGAVKAAVS